MAARTTTRVPMPIKMRAKQFAMFDALKGLTEAIAEKERQLDPRKELSEERVKEINDVLQTIEQDDMVTVMYYCQYGRQYRQLSGPVTKIDSYWKVLQINGVSISFDEIYEISENAVMPIQS